MPSVKWATGYELNVASVTTNTTAVNDTTNSVAPYDTTTYVQHTTGSGSANLTVIWDLDTASTVTRVRFNGYYTDGGNYSVMASNDGTSWTNVFTLGIPAWLEHLGVGSWESVNTTGITTTQYRYWRYSLEDTQLDIFGPHDARVGEFRLWNGSTEYTISGGSAQTITLTSGIATGEAFGTHALSNPKTLSGVASITGINSISF